MFLIGSALSLLSTASAQYYPLSQNTLTVYVNNPEGGFVSPNNGTHQYYYGTTMTAVACTNSGYAFDGWYLNGIFQGKLTTISVTMTQDYTLYAVFSVRTVCLTINSNPSWGGMTTPPSGIQNCTVGNSISVSETPNSGYTFSGWYLGGVYQGAGTIISVPMTQDIQLNAFFAGNGSNPTPTDTPGPTPQPTPTPSPNMPVPILSFYCSSSTTTSGFNVRIQGALSYNDTGLSTSGVAFSYSANGGSTWHDLAYFITGDYGNFSGVWMPSASGYYIIKGTWAGDSVYASTTTTVNFAVEPLANQNQNVFSVTSNSTVTSLAFDSTQNQLSFSVSGPSGTTGYVQICTPKSLVSDISKLQVSLDGQSLQYNLVSQNDVWIVTIQYHHSSHSVVMALRSCSCFINLAFVIADCNTDSFSNTYSPTQP